MPIKLDHPQRAILVCAVTYNNQIHLKKSLDRLQGLCGRILFETIPYHFVGNEYYAREMGDGLLKKFIVFEKQILQHKLYEQKLQTIKIEKLLATKSNETDLKRNVNIDPGLLTTGNLVLSSSKYSPHRTSIGPGIFAELTLLYEKGIYKPLPWTYLDYKNKLVQDILRKTRQHLKIYIRNI